PAVECQPGNRVAAGAEYLGHERLLLASRLSRSPPTSIRGEIANRMPRVFDGPGRRKADSSRGNPGIPLMRCSEWRKSTTQGCDWHCPVRAASGGRQPPVPEQGAD